MPETGTTSRKTVVILALLLTFVVGTALLIISVISVHMPDPLKTSLNVIGGFMALSVAVSFLYHVTLRPQDDAARKEELRQLLDEKIDQSIAGCNRYGLNGFYSEMHFINLFDDLKKGDELWWLDTYAPNYLGFVSHLRNALRRGAIIHMLVLNPECQNAEYRAEEIGDLYRPTSFKKELRKFWEDMTSCMKEAKEDGALELRWYEGLPCMPMYIILRDGKVSYAYTSFFLRHPTGIEFPHIKWEQGAMLNNFLDYVQNKWEVNKQNVELPMPKEAITAGVSTKSP
jgi:hypothetical protein